MKPPPPIGLACGSTTDSAKEIAIEESIALPPFFNISFPTLEAKKWRVTTIDSFDSTVLPSLTISACVNVRGNNIINKKIILFTIKNLSFS